MTIDEAIEELKSENGYYANNGMTDVAEFNTKIIRLLEDYKQIKMLIPIEQALKAEYNKAIDDFAENISLEISESLIWGMIADCFKYKNLNDTSDKIVDYVINTANEIAEQLKAGGK